MESKNIKQNKIGNGLNIFLSPSLVLVLVEAERNKKKIVHHKVAAGLRARESALKLDNLISVWRVQLA